MRTSKCRSLSFGAAAMLTLVAVAPVTAEPLAKDMCDALAAEQQTLLATGVRDDFAKGADWGKSNLKTDRLAQIARYIYLEEQLNFRCGLAKVRFTLPPDEDTAATAAAAVEQAKADAKEQDAPEPPKPPSKPKASTKSAAKAKTADDAPAQPTTKPAAKIQAKVKPKADDAFKPAPAAEKE